MWQLQLVAVVSSSGQPGSRSNCATATLGFENQMGHMVQTSAWTGGSKSATIPRTLSFGNEICRYQAGVLPKTWGSV